MPTAISCIRTSRPITKAGTQSSSASPPAICTCKSNYQDFQRYAEVDLAIAADAEATLPSLIEAVKRLLTDDRKTRVRGPRNRNSPRSATTHRAARDAAAYGWDASPISTARLCAEIWGADQERRLVAGVERAFVSDWPLRLWNFDKHYQYIGGVRRLRRRVRRAGGGRRGAGQQEARPADGQHSE